MLGCAGTIRGGRRWRIHGALGEALLAAGDHELAVEASLRAIRGPAEALPAAFAGYEAFNARRLATTLRTLGVSDEDVEDG